MKVYLSKSNKATYDHVALVRDSLKKLGCEVVEWQGGGPYDSTVMTKSERVIVVTAGLLPILGKGLVQEMDVALNHGMPLAVVSAVKPDRIMVCNVKSSNQIKILDAENYVKTAELVGPESSISIEEFLGYSTKMDPFLETPFD